MERRPTQKALRNLALRNLVLLSALSCIAPLCRPGLLRAQTADERILFDDANRERTQRGLSPLRWDAQLAAAARQHASLMAQQNTLSHQLTGEPEPTTRARQAGAKFSALAENVADAPSVAEIHEGWMNSPPHRKNLLDPQLNSVGIAVVAAPEGQLFAAQDFSRAVFSLSLDDQEARVRAQLKARGLALSGDHADARRACQQGPGHETGRPAYMLRYSSVDLGKLPDLMDKTLRSGRYHAAEVGACAPAHAGDFAEYQVAVLLYE